MAAITKAGLIFGLVLSCGFVRASEPPPACETEFVFTVPSDDRWHYPFNFTPGFRPVASCFGAADLDGFNDRDGCLILAWETSGLIEAGLDPNAYDIAGMSITVTNLRDAQWAVDLSVDEWTTYGEGRHDPDPGRPIELFGVGFDTENDEDSWTEGVFFVGSTSEENIARDPFPFVYRDGTGTQVHVEDSVKGLHNQDLLPPLCSAPSGVCPFTPSPWAIGVPKEYVPGNQSLPFDVRFEVDLSLSDGAVREYAQRQLSNGRIIVFVTSMAEAEIMGSQAGFPAFFMREGVPLDANAKAPSLVVVLRMRGSGDWDEDGFASPDDWFGLAGCLNGPEPSEFAGPQERCLCTFDLDEDGDVDLTDVSIWNGFLSG